MATQPAAVPPAILPEVGQRLPPFELPALDGQTYRYNQFRHRSNLALVFLPERPGPDDEAYLRALAQAAPELEVTDSRLLVVTMLPADEAAALKQRVGLKAPVLLDPGREAYCQYGLLSPSGPCAGVFIADRYLLLIARAVGSSLPETMSVGEIVDWLRYVDFQCPECGT